MKQFSALALSLTFGLSGAGTALAANTVTGAVQSGTTITTGTSNGSSSANSGTNVSGGTNGSDTSVSGNGSSNTTSGSATSDTSSSAGLNINLMQGDVQNSTTGVTVTSALDVTTNDSLSAYANSVVKGDTNVDAVAVNDQGMDMTYRRPAHFLGFIPASMKVRVHLDNNGAVSVHYPWYAFLMSGTEARADLESKLQAQVTSMQSAEATASAKASASASSMTNRMRAMILEKLQAALHAGVSADASASANSQ
ncbi:MAG: LPXTG-motif cell wall anchor domain protein [Parcubacteria group bacterium]|nr:LPXTG-motif cell wall anchor domain protein [Parcubacteria group bacterium]